MAASGGILVFFASACSSGGGSSASRATPGSGSEQVAASDSVQETDQGGTTTQVAVVDTASAPVGTLVLPRTAKPVFTGESAAVEKAFRGNLDALERKDLDSAIGFQSKAAQKDGTRSGMADFMDSYRILLYRITNIEVNGQRAAVYYEDAIVGRNLKSDVTTILAQHDEWVKEDGAWKFVSDVSSAPGIPKDLAVVAITLRDSRQIVVAGPLPKGEFAFSVKNAGADTRGLFILGLPADLDVPGLLKDMESGKALPDNVLEMGAISDIPAGNIAAMVFNRALPTGRYLLISRRVADANHETPILSGEYAEFSIQ